MCSARKFVRISKYLLAGVTVFCVSWIASVNEWNAGVRWKSRRAEPLHSTMRTIVAYSEEAQAELDKPSPVTCHRLPSYPEVPIINDTWTRGAGDRSWQKVKGTSVSLYAAYYDTRSPQKYIRIVAMLHGRNISEKELLYCQTRPMNPSEASVEVVAAKPLEMWWHEWDSNSSDIYTPLLLSCPLTDALTAPSVVSVVQQPCDDPSNGFHLRTYPNKEKSERTFTICVKDMLFSNDITKNLIEWIEINRLLGVDMIDMYIDNVNEKNEGILDNYRIKGFVRLFKAPIKNNPSRTLWQRRRDHIVTYNDCLYRNIKESKFIVPLDIDEVLLPKKSYTWNGLLKRLILKGWNSSKYSAILVRNVFFFDFMQNVNMYKFKDNHRNTNEEYIKRDDVRLNKTEAIELADKTNLEYLVNDSIRNVLYEKHRTNCGDTIPVPKLASHIMSSAVVSPIGHYSKSIMVTSKVLTAFNHYPLANLGSPGFAIWSAPYSEVQLNHYKESCNTTLVAECDVYGTRARVDRSALHLRRRLMHTLAMTLCSKINYKK